MHHTSYPTIIRSSMKREQMEDDSCVNWHIRLGTLCTTQWISACPDRFTLARKKPRSETVAQAVKRERDKGESAAVHQEHRPTHSCILRRAYRAATSPSPATTLDHHTSRFLPSPLRGSGEGPGKTASGVALTKDRHLLYRRRRVGPSGRRASSWTVEILQELRYRL